MIRHLAQSVGPNRNIANAAFMLGLFAILGALAFEHIGGLYPCVLCLDQRWPYYFGLPILAVVIFAWDALPAPLRIALTLVVGGLFVWGAGLGVYHSGVEWGIFAGPQSCVGVGDAVSFDMLSNLDSARVVPCDEVQFEILGISLAGFNAIISAAIAIMLGFSAFGQFRRMRH